MVLHTSTRIMESYIDSLATPAHTEVRPWYSDVSSDGPIRPYNQEDRTGLQLSDKGTTIKDVLVVEDETYLCELIADVLEAEGHNARKAANGQEALDRVRERTPQLILLDLMMPVMDGWEFMQALRANPDWSNIPVVIITAIYDIKRTQQQTGAKAVLTKPFDIEEVARIIRIYAT